MSTDLSNIKEVRAVRRALLLVDAMGKHGWMTPTELARETQVDRGTIYRLLVSLIRAGYVIRRPQDNKFFLSRKMLNLSRGFLAEDRESLVLSSVLAKLTDKIRWPSDYAMILAGQLTIMESSHHLTAMTFFRSLVGQTRPIFRTSLGKAIISGMSAQDREVLLGEIINCGGEDAEDLKKPGLVDSILEDFNERGFALSFESGAADIAAIALPVRRCEKIVGAVNVVIFKRAFNLRQVEESYLEPLRNCVYELESEFERLAKEDESRRQS